MQHAGRRNLGDDEAAQGHGDHHGGRLLLTVDGAEPEQQGCDQQASLGHYPGDQRVEPGAAPLPTHQHRQPDKTQDGGDEPRQGQQQIEGLQAVAGTQQHQVGKGRPQQYHLQQAAEPALDLHQTQPVEGERHGGQPQQGGGDGALALQARLDQGEHDTEHQGGPPTPDEPARNLGLHRQHQREPGDHPDREELGSDPRALARAEIPAPQDEPHSDQGPQGHQTGQGKEPKRKLDEHRVSGSSPGAGAPITG